MRLGLACSDATVEAKVAGMRKAIKSHSGVIKQCAVANGIDRHFFALKSMASKEGYDSPLPALFEDPAQVGRYSTPLAHRVGGCMGVRARTSRGSTS